MRFLDRVAARLGYGRVEKTTSWEKLWLRALESTLLGDRVTQPYRQHWAVYLAVSTIAKVLADLAFNLWEDDDQVWEHPVIGLLRRPNQLMSGSDIWIATSTFLDIRGECFWILESSRGMAAGIGGSLPAEIYVPDPENFRPVEDSSRNLVGWTYRNIPLRMDEVIHFKLFNPHDPIRGQSPLDAARASMETDYRAVKYNQRFFDDAAEPSGALVTQGSLTDEQYRRLLAQWEARHQGKRKVALLEGGLEYKQVGLNHRDMDFLEQRKFSRDEVLAVYGVPKTVAGFTEEINMATAQFQLKRFWTVTMLPRMGMIEDKLNAEFFPRFAPGIEGFFDRDSIEELREDLGDKVKVCSELWKMGFTANEINERLDLGFEPKPWRDVAWVPVGLVPAAEAMTPPEDRTPPSAELPADEGLAALPAPEEKGTTDDAYRRRFLVLQAAEEEVFARRVKRFLFEQRRRAIGALKRAGRRDCGPGETKDGEEELARIIAEIAVIFSEEDEKLALFARPLYEQAARRAVEAALQNLGIEIAFDLLDPEVLELIASRVNRIKGVNATIWRQLRAGIREGVAAGETIERIASRIRETYNMAASRSRTIARTETAGIMNEASFQAYRSKGAARKRWLTAHDERVRHSHTAAEAQGPVPISQRFGNGMLHPGDPAGGASEVINCRCTLVPVLEVE